MKKKAKKPKVKTEIRKKAKISLTTKNLQNQISWMLIKMGIKRTHEKSSER